MCLSEVNVERFLEEGVRWGGGGRVVGVPLSETKCLSTLEMLSVDGGFPGDLMSTVGPETKLCQQLPVWSLLVLVRVSDLTPHF